MGILLTKRRAVDLCRVATCLCCRHWLRRRPRNFGQDPVW